jgi:toxin YoeB
LYWQIQDKKTVKRINELIRGIERDPKQPKGKAEILKGDLAGCRSVRIDKTNRLIYRLKNEMLHIVSCRGHYEE